MSLSKWVGKKTDSSPEAKAKAALAQLPPWKKGRVRTPFPVGDRETYKGPFSDHDVRKAIEAAPIKTVDLKNVVGIQHSVIPERVAFYIDHPNVIPEGARGEHGGLIDKPIIVHQGGTTFAYDGHHRLTAEYLRGKKKAVVRYADLDAIAAAKKKAESAA